MAALLISISTVRFKQFIAIPCREKGENSELHIIIFDEIDAICKQRGSVKDGSGVHDTLVNQLLTKVSFSPWFNFSFLCHYDLDL